MLIRVALAFVIGGMVVPASVPAQDPASPRPVEARASAPVNLNAASADQLEALPGIGPQTAARIVEYRQKHGGFKKIEELMNVKGIGEKSFLKIKPLITVTAPRAERPASQ